MNWLDVAGPPGSGKSTLADPLWGPHAIPIEDRLPPASWAPFLEEITRLFGLIEKHPTIDAAHRMVNRSVRKIATVARARGFHAIPPWHDGDELKEPDEICPMGVYIQTALAQRGLGFGWRMVDLGIDMKELRPYFQLMPVSIGVAFTKCPPEIVEERNRARRLVRETRHEDRHRMVGLMMPAIDIAKEVLHGRGVPTVEIDTTQPIEAARAQLLAFASLPPFDSEADGHSREAPALSQPPSWWRSGQPGSGARLQVDDRSAVGLADGAGPHHGPVEAETGRLRGLGRGPAVEHEGVWVPWPPPYTR